MGLPANPAGREERKNDLLGPSQVFRGERLVSSNPRTRVAWGHLGADPAPQRVCGEPALLATAASGRGSGSATCRRLLPEFVCRCRRPGEAPGFCPAERALSSMVKAALFPRKWAATLPRCLPSDGDREAGVKEGKGKGVAPTTFWKNIQDPFSGLVKTLRF